MPAPHAGVGPVAELYRCLWLEPLIEVALGLAHDVLCRPAGYRRIPRATLAAALQLQRAVGTDTALPGPTQRAAIYRSFLDAGLLDAGAALRRSASHEVLVQRRARPALVRETAEATTALRARLAGLAETAAVVVPPIQNVLGLAMELLELDGITERAGLPVVDLDRPQRRLHRAGLDAALVQALATVAGTGARTLAAAAGPSGETIMQEAHAWNRALTALAQHRVEGAQPRLGLVGTGGWPGRKCLFWLCDYYWVCGFLPGRIWPTCFKARICYCAIYQA